MDLSKLPKLSNTGQQQQQQPQAAPPEPPAPTPADSPIPMASVAPSSSPQLPPPHQLNYIATGVESIGLAEAWISIGLGLLLLLIFPATISYLRSPAAFQQNNPVTDAQGNPLPYIKSVFFWRDLGVTVFALALILEGIALAGARKVTPIMIAFAVTVVAAIFNVGVIIYAEPIIGFPIFSGVGVVILGYMALTQWRLINMLRRWNTLTR